MWQKEPPSRKYTALPRMRCVTQGRSLTLSEPSVLIQAEDRHLVLTFTDRSLGISKGQEGPPSRQAGWRRGRPSAGRNGLPTKALTPG